MTLNEICWKIYIIVFFPSMKDYIYIYNLKRERHFLFFQEIFITRSKGHIGYKMISQVDICVNLKPLGDLTVIIPYMIYPYTRMQLGLFRAPTWLWPHLQQVIFFPCKLTSKLTYGTNPTSVHERPWKSYQHFEKR